MSVKLPTFFKNKEFEISITHIPSKQKVTFFSWLTGFTDAFTSTWSGTPVYGRMDDLYTFQKTSRNITISFDIIAKDELEAIQNRERLNRLTQFLYPVYSNPVGGGMSRENSQVLQAAPLLKMKFNSFVQNAGDNTELVGFLNGFTHQPTIESGPFIVNKQTTKDIIYQLTPVQLNFTVLHTHLTGWVRDTTSNRYSFGSSDKPQIGNNFPHHLKNVGGLDPEGVATADQITADIGPGAAFDFGETFGDVSAPDEDEQASNEEILNGPGGS
jgi:hypothetical protein